MGLLKPDSPILADVDDAVWEDNYAGEVRAEQVDIKSACLVIRLSDDILQALLGSGLKCDDSEFAYILNGEIRTSSFSYAERKPTVTLSQFTKFALADDSYWAKDFMQAEGMVQDQQNPGVITRTDQAVGQHGGTDAPLHQKNPHQSSLKVQTIADLLVNRR
jgi:hypothetical protein